MDTSSFKDKLRELRIKSGLTQQELADKAELSLATVAGLERGKYIPSWPSVVALSAALGVKTDDFQLPPAAASEPPGRGRPAKAVEPETPKKPRKPKG